MKKSIKLFIKCLIPIPVYLAVTMATGALTTPLFGIDLSHIEMPGQTETFIGLFTVISDMTLEPLWSRSCHLQSIHVTFSLKAPDTIANYSLVMQHGCFFFHDYLATGS